MPSGRRVLIVDHSGRGHAAADLFARTRPDAVVHYVPGCAAIREDRIVTAPQVPFDDGQALVAYARETDIDLVYVSNPVSVAEGVVDAFREAGFRVVGPDRRAARLESSKVEAKALFRRYGIPTPEHEVFEDPASARAYVSASPHELVVKADGMSGGNGAYVCDDPETAISAIEELMVKRRFGAAGDRIIVERRHYGRELSFFALLDGDSYSILPMSADYPKSDDGNLGIDSAGMGALCPHPLETPALAALIEQRLLHPVLRIIQEEKLDYRGVIYLGCLMDNDEPLLLEINARMGDPEAEVIYPRIESDFFSLAEAMIDGSLHRHPVHLNALSMCTVSVTQGPTRSGLPGWPYGDHDRGHEIHGFDQIDPSEARLFIGQATLRDGRVVTDGGRVAQVCGFGTDLDAAARNAYANVTKLDFEGIRFRTDIGRRMPWDVAPMVGQPA